MKVVTKTFRAENVLLALEKAKTELGSDAIVVSMHSVPAGPAWQIWRHPMVEIIATRSISSSQPAEEALETSIPLPEPEKAGQSNRAMANLFSKAGADDTSINVKKLNAPVAPASSIRNETSFRPPVNRHEEKTDNHEAVLPISRALAKVVARLRSQGVDDEILKRFSRVCQENLPPNSLDDENRVFLNFQQQMIAAVRVMKPALALSQRFIFLIGNTGCGKTSLCAKLTAYIAQNMGKTTAWISTDTVRTAAIAEARTFTGLLGVQLQLAYTPEEFGALTPQPIHADLVIVDTPGCNPYQERSVVELGAILTQVPQRNIFLVLSATTKEADMKQMLAAFSPFNIRGLIFTKMDETNSFGPLYNMAFHSQIPLAFFSSGTQVFQDLQPAQAEGFISLIMGK
jgi:flagellar biosynthesis protein FlhF